MSADLKTFPILYPYSRKPKATDVLAVPWFWIIEYEKQAKRNHDQTIQRLSERGGLDPQEIWCAVKGIGLWDPQPSHDECVAWLNSYPWEHGQ